MMKKFLSAAFAAAALIASGAEEKPQAFNILADLIQADPATQSLVASGNVTAVHTPFKMLSAGVSKDAKNVYRFENPTMFTTCTNEIGNLHWHVSGGFEYQDGEYALLRDGWVHFWEIPILWIPYLYMPSATIEGFRMMPGYTGRWGAYLLTEYSCHLAGKRAEEDPEGWGLGSRTRFDLRYEQGIALGETLDWRLGDFGEGRFNVYYAWDRSDEYDDDVYAESGHWNRQNWGSDVDDERYALELVHRWEMTERDTLRLFGSIYSDSYFRRDFMRKSPFMLKNQFLGYQTSEIAQEHLENWGGAGVSVSGPLNDFVGGTSRLPEFYLDVNPLPVFDLPLVYESANRAGFLRRTLAYYGKSGAEPTAYNRVPGRWADYDTCRIDTYHRLSAPFKVADVLSVVPRLAYRGTYWGEAGDTDLTGWSKAKDVSSDVFRSILEGGITFSARGTADHDGWRHMIEPYFDVLAQEAWYSGLDGHARPYVFDSLDASLDWSDQFASRGRNLPYSWYGFTPGVRNVIESVDEKGVASPLFDLDVYSAFQCNDTDWYGGSGAHKLAKAGSPNYGKNSITPVPGFRVGWHPSKDVSFAGRLEYDAENNKIALAEARFDHRLDEAFKYYVDFMQTDYRRWDFSSTPDTDKGSDALNFVEYSFLRVGFEHELCDAVAWSPYINWDCLYGTLDSVGAWIDFRTDCLGFRFLVEYEDEYETIDGYTRDEDWSFGFYIYLRAFGADSGNLFGGR